VIDANVFIKQQVRSFLPHLHSTLPPSSSISHPRTFYTTPGVLSEIRDSKSRAVLQELRDIHQITILERNPTSAALSEMVRFTKLTGDYHSLSRVDLDVLALTRDLERELGLERGDSGAYVVGEGVLGHLRKVPKRVLGKSGINTVLIKKKVNGCVEETKVDKEEVEDEEDSSEESSDEDECDSEDCDEEVMEEPAGPKTWAKLVNSAASIPPAASPLAAPFSQIKLQDTNEPQSLGGQFDDAEESDEEEEANAVTAAFPSLAESLAVPYDGSDDEAVNSTERLRQEEEARAEAARRSLQPISKNKNGALYNSFKKYDGVVQKQGLVVMPRVKGGGIYKEMPAVVTPLPALAEPTEAAHMSANANTNTSRIMGSSTAMQSSQVDDDGEGWITTDNFHALKSSPNGGFLPPKETTNSPTNPNGGFLPPTTHRAACATSDFAMQNTLLQMNLVLLNTTSGSQIRKLKTWVLRCQACRFVYTDQSKSRLFCDKCGSGNTLHRVSASLNGDTGRLKLHLKKNFVHKTRGTKFSLPKSGGNRFQGDLLLREDQLMMGAWNQKVRQNTGAADNRGVFGSDIATHVGLDGDFGKRNDIKVGFGRNKNPNATRFGRERRGKKKKDDQKACGLRRY